MKGKNTNCKREKYMSWDTYFMSVAVTSSFRSKDPTQNGACIVDSEKKIVGIGYNGMPRGIDENKSCYWSDEDEDIINSRHTYVVHAEKNAIFNSIHHDLRGCAIYMKQIPCNICAQGIIQVGIKKVVYLFSKEHTDKHKKRNDAVKQMFKDTGIMLVNYYDLDIKDKDWIKKLEELNEEFYSKQFLHLKSYFKNK